MAQKISNILRVCVSLVIVSFLILFLDPASILNTLLSMNVMYIIPAFIVYALTFLILAYRWQKILQDAGINVSLISAYSAFVGGVLISDVTPGRIGDFSRSLLLSSPVESHKGMLSVILDRCMDLITIIILGLLGLAIFIPSHGGKLIWALFIPASALLILVILWYSKNNLQNIIALVGSTKLNEFIGEIKEAAASVRSPKKIVLRSVVLTVVVWCGHVTRILIIGASLGYSLPAFALFFTLPLISALSLVPITISGLGLVEGTFAVILSDIGLPLSVGLTIALIDRCITIAFHLFIGIPVIKKKF